MKTAKQINLLNFFPYLYYQFISVSRYLVQNFIGRTISFFRWKFMVDRKRKRQYLCNKSKWKKIKSGISGLLFTCEGKEKQAVREVYNILHEIIEKRFIYNAEFTNNIDQSKNYEEKMCSARCVMKWDQDSEEEIADSVKRFCDQGCFIFFF